MTEQKIDRTKKPLEEHDLEHRDKQVNQYDKLLRENMDNALPGIIRNLLMIDIVKSVNIPDNIQHTKERRPDLLKKVTDSKGTTFILHMEYQLENLKSMVHRMLDYKAMLYRKYGLPVNQYVLFIGKGTPTMPTEINIQNLTFRFNLIAISSIDYTVFLNSDKPEEQVIAMLANFNKEDPELVLTKIIKKVQASSKGELAENKFFKHLRILAQLRNFELITVEIMETLDKYYKIERDPLYIRGVATNQEHIIKNLILQFGFTDEQIVAATEAAIEYVRKIRESLKK